MEQFRSCFEKDDDFGPAWEEPVFRNLGNECLVPKEFSLSEVSRWVRSLSFGML
jgi:hypothetical protein